MNETEWYTLLNGYHPIQKRDVIVPPSSDLDNIERLTLMCDGGENTNSAKLINCHLVG